MPYYLQLRIANGRPARVDEPYDDLDSAREDASIGAKQIVGEALKAGFAIHTIVDSRIFEIVDNTEKLIVSLTFWELLKAEKL